jgi:hypothetical protein
MFNIIVYIRDKYLIYIYIRIETLIFILQCEL